MKAPPSLQIYRRVVSKIEFIIRQICDACSRLFRARRCSGPGVWNAGQNTKNNPEFRGRGCEPCCGRRPRNIQSVIINNKIINGLSCAHQKDTAAISVCRGGCPAPCSPSDGSAAQDPSQGGLYYMRLPGLQEWDPGHRPRHSSPGHQPGNGSTDRGSGNTTIEGISCVQKDFNI